MAELDEHDLALLEIGWKSADDDHGGCAKDVLSLVAEVRRLRAAVKRIPELERERDELVAGRIGLRAALKVEQERAERVETAAVGLLGQEWLDDALATAPSEPDDGAVAVSSMRFDQLVRVEAAARRWLDNEDRLDSQVAIHSSMKARDEAKAELRTALAAAPAIGLSAGDAGALAVRRYGGALRQLADVQSTGQPEGGAAAPTPTRERAVGQPRYRLEFGPIESHVPVVGPDGYDQRCPMCSEVEVVPSVMGGMVCMACGAKGLRSIDNGQAAPAPGEVKGDAGQS